MIQARLHRFYDERLTRLASPKFMATVFIVDDDPHICDTLRRLLESARFRTKEFVSPKEFLDYIQPDMPGCLILDVCMPWIGGLKLQDELIARKIGLPVIFVSGYAAIALAVDAIKKGAFDFIEKPFRKSLIAAAQRRSARPARR